MLPTFGHPPLSKRPGRGAPTATSGMRRPAPRGTPWVRALRNLRRPGRDTAATTRSPTIWPATRDGGPYGQSPCLTPTAGPTGSSERTAASMRRPAPRYTRVDHIDTFRRLEVYHVAVDHLDDLRDPVRGYKLLRQDGDRRPLHRVDAPSTRPCRTRSGCRFRPPTSRTMSPRAVALVVSPGPEGVGEVDGRRDRSAGRGLPVGAPAAS